MPGRAWDWVKAKLLAPAWRVAVGLGLVVWLGPLYGTLLAIGIALVDPKEEHRTWWVWGSCLGISRAVMATVSAARRSWVPAALWAISAPAALALEIVRYFVRKEGTWPTDPWFGYRSGR